MKTFVFLAIVLFSFSCSCQKNQQKSSSAFDEISFGSSGGFTGMGNVYLLKANGEVFKQSEAVPSKINKISKKEVKQISKIIIEKDFNKLAFSEKGNMNYFIEIKAGTSVNKLSWTDSSQSPEIKEFYKTLIATLKQK